MSRSRLAKKQHCMKVMAELIQQYVERIRGAGAEYIVRACGEQGADGFWNGWLEFHDTTETMPPIRDGRPTRHRDHGALTRWAAGLEKRDFERAFRQTLILRPADAVAAAASYRA